MARPHGRVAIVGGGIAGLALAFYLERRGVEEIEVFEGSPQLGGLGTFFEYEGHTFERFYHCMLPSDHALLGLLGELGLQDDTYWKETEFGYLWHGRVYPLNRPVDLLSFSPLTFQSRLRVGLTALYGKWCSEAGLDDVTAYDWLLRLSGSGAVERFWEPMLAAKYGDHARKVPALWFWTRLRREKGGRKEVKGYIRGGYRRIIAALSERLRSRGVAIHLEAPVERISTNCGNGVEVDGCFGLRRFDRVVLTLAPPLLRSLRLEGEVAHAVERIPPLDYQGVVNVIVFLSRPLTGKYWVAAISRELPFQGFVETSALLDEGDTGGMTVVHLMRYLHRSHPRFQLGDETITEDVLEGLKRSLPQFKEEYLLATRVFRAGFVEPLYETGYLNRRPPFVLVPGRVFLGSTAQIYPGVTSWNGSVVMVHRLLDALATSSGTQR